MAFRNAVLGLAVDNPFARRLVNAGRLSVPCELTDSALNGHDDPAFNLPQRVGMVALDAPLKDSAGTPCWLMSQLGGAFTCLVIGDTDPDSSIPDGLAVVRIGKGAFADIDGKVAERYGSGVYLIRPDQHVAARWKHPQAGDIATALAHCAAHMAA